MVDDWLERERKRPQLIFLVQGLSQSVSWKTTGRASENDRHPARYTQATYTAVEGDLADE